MREKPDKNANIINVIGPDVKIELYQRTMAGHRLSSRARQAMSALTTSSQIWQTALQTAAHQEMQIVLHSHSNRYMVR